MKKILIVGIILLYTSSLIIAQDGKSVFNFMRFPTSARAGALGGTNVSLVENDLSLVYQNPAFLGQEMDMNLNFNYLSFISDIGMGSVAFAKAMGTRSTWGAGINYARYGSMSGTDADRTLTGDLSVNDVCANAFFSRDLTEKIRGGVTGKFIYSSLDQYTSLALGFDLGLSYYDKDNDFSLGLVAKNVGGQVKAYNEINEPLPWDIQLGLTKRLAHAPIRFSVTAMYLNKWKFYDVLGEEENFATTLANHLVFGVEFLPTENFWIGLGYNVKNGTDMKLQDTNKMAGFSAGAGLRVKAFNIGCSVGRYHPSATSFLLSLTTSLSELNL